MTGTAHGRDVAGMTNLGRYAIQSVLGQGGYAVVYLALDTALGRQVAVKTLLPHTAAQPEVRERFLHEARAIAAMGHPSIVTIHDVGEEGGQPFYAMEYIEGESIEEAVPPGERLPLDEVLAIVAPVASALDYLHMAGIVHRDIKPGNIMRARSGRIVLMDFGIARAFDATTLTATGAVVGTPAYMSPEQALGQRVGAATDIYALTVVVYALLAGRPPFQGATARVMFQHAYEPPPPLRRFRPDLPAGVQEAVAWGLAKDPAARPPTAGALLAALRGEQAAPPLSTPVAVAPAVAAPVAAAALAETELLPAPAPAATTTGDPPPVSPPGRRPSRPLLLAGVALAALVLLGGGALAASRLWGGDDRSGASEPPPGVFYESNGNEHVTLGQAHGAYFSNPPTSGWHMAELPHPGVYTEARTPESLPHFLEHGGVWILYRPGIDESKLAELRDLTQFKLDLNKPVALAPYPAPGYAVPEKPINVIAWQRLLALDEVDRGEIERFIDWYHCAYTPEGGGPGCEPEKRGEFGPAQDAGPAGFGAVTATPVR